MEFLHPFNLLAGAHPFAGAFAHHVHRQMMHSFNEPDIVETDDGYLISAHVPGVNAADLSIKVTAQRGASSAALSVKGPGEVDYNLRLPVARADLANVAASCIDGVLRVAVPKTPVTEHAVPVAAALPGAGADDDGSRDESGDEFTLRVPGFAPSDISVTVKSTGHLVIEGKSERRGSFKKQFRVDPAVTTTPNRVSAACADGLLSVAVAPVPGDAQFDVLVSTEEPEPAATKADGDGDNVPTDRMTLIRREVPGLAAQDISVTVSDGVVRVSGKADRSAGRRRCFSRVAFEKRLPEGVESASVAASCKHGVLAVTCGAPAAPTEFEVAVSGDRLACLGHEAHADGKGEEPAE